MNQKKRTKEIMEIYKYISIDDKIIDSIFQSNMIKYSEILKLNDPFDLQPFILGAYEDKEEDIKWKNNWIEKFITNDISKNKEKELDDFFQYYHDNSDKSVSLEIFLKSPMNYIIKDTYKKMNLSRLGLLSLSSKKNDLLMWSHYANSHQGIVIGFNKNHEYFKQNKSIKDYEGLLRIVKYQYKKPKIYLMEDREFLFTKSNHWKYENEYRVIKKLENLIKICDIYVDKFPKDLISSVTFGLKISEEHKLKILDILSKTNMSIKIFDTKINSEEYKLDFEEIKI